ncbi:PilZ domain-containing protein [Bradyrhizobium diazoefficiens]
MVAFWSVVNIVVLFFVCMTSLQARMGRAEERFDVDESVLILTGTGEVLSGRVSNVSLSGAGVLLGAGIDCPRAGEPLRVHIAQVGWIDAMVVQQRGHLVGLQFHLPQSLERDLLIRKLFTVARLRGNGVIACSVNRAMLKNIWSMAAPLPHIVAGGAKPASFSPTERLPAESLVIRPQPRIDDLAHLAGVRSRHPASFTEPHFGRVAGTVLEAVKLS